MGVIVLALTVSQAHAAESFLDRPEVQSYVRTVSQENNLNQHQIAGYFTEIRSQQGILDAISRPAERALSWREYRPIFIKQKRINAGREFMRVHQALLQRAEERYGVPGVVIAAIIGVESFYGKFTGKHGVLESIATLAFDYPPRAAFFKQELTEFLVLASAEQWDAPALRGSYAGAMGMPQFISSSYRQYSVDFDEDGQRDLWHSSADVIGSVANYLARHGWQRDQPIAQQWAEAAGRRDAVTSLLRKNLKPVIAPDVLRKLGVEAAGDQFVSVMRMQGSGGEETWVGYANFYAITRYNHSAMYALAVYQLSRELEAE